MLKDLKPAEVQTELANDPELVLIDVREKWEYEIVHLPQARLMPLSSFTQNLHELDKAKKYLFMCHHGSRSMQVCVYLLQLGFQNVYNANGGIHAYAAEIDKSLRTY
ncbi:MAG: sulfurtransferase [Ignavibacteria bacterium]|nr:sulfurtransferase [Ignavibacteria bacterium]